MKGTGQQAVECILAARAEGGPFKDLFDFCLRVDKRLVNRRTIEALIRAGAFDTLDPSRDRAQLIASVSIAMEAADQAERNAHQGGLFEMFGSGDDAVAEAPQYVSVRPWSASAARCRPPRRRPRRPRRRRGRCSARDRGA